MSAPTDRAAERHWICARRLRARRLQLRLTQTQVVDILAGRGAVLTNRALSAMEHGRGLDLGRLPDLAAALNCTVTYLVGLTDDPVRWEPDDLTGPPPAAPARPAHRNWILGPHSPWSGG